MRPGIPSERAVDIVQQWADHDAARTALTFYDSAGRAEPATYGRLAQEASASAALFRRRGLRPGDAVVLLARTVRPFVSALLGAQQVGLLAIPCPAPGILESGRRVADRVDEILRRSAARAVFDPVPGPPDPDLAAALSRGGVALLTAADVGDLGAADDAGGTVPFAYCQFTSGSGGAPKGVLLTHANVLANVRARRQAYGLGERDVAVAWLPLFHDMGLVGYVLGPLLEGYPAHLLSPAAFVARPLAWLSLISRVRATISTAPNFAYAVCARRATDADLAQLDLASWRCACNGAEPVTRDAVDAFVKRFAPVGFRASAMLPAYGLAENTLTVSARRPGEGPRFDAIDRDALERDGRACVAGEGASSTVASVGRPLPGHEVAIRGADGESLGERRVGEIVVRGASVMHGYLPGTEGESALTADGGLLTGDLGYVADGELFVVGRRKDVIIRGGRNYFPQDIEDAASRVDGVRTGRVVAFAAPGGDRERLVIAVECREGWRDAAERLREEVRRQIFAAVRLNPDEIVLLPAHALPLTTSGKPKRPEVRHQYVAGTLAGGSP